MLQFLLLAIAIIVYGSLYPFHFEFTPRAAHPILAVWSGWPAEWDRYTVRDVILNVILYVPLGLAAAMVFLRRHARAVAAMAAILLAAGVSAAMELAQVYEPGRDPSSLDVLTNLLGGVVGVCVAVAAERQLRGLVKAPPQALRAAAVILLAAWGIQEFYPLFPAIGRAHLRDALSLLWHSRRLPWVETWLGVAEWFAVGLALESIFARMRASWLAALMAFSLGAQLVIADRSLTLAETLAAVLALVLWRFSPAGGRARWGAWLLAGAILLRQLQPFYFLAVPQSFSWAPFAATLEGSRESAVIIIARKAFDYGALVFALRRAGWNYVRAGLVVAAALLVTEAIQMYLPGRTPEITDALLAILMMVVLRKAGK